MGEAQINVGGLGKLFVFILCCVLVGQGFFYLWAVMGVFFSFVISELQCFMLGFIYLLIGLLSFNQWGMYETLLLFGN